MFDVFISRCIAVGLFVVALKCNSCEASKERIEREYTEASQYGPISFTISIFYLLS